VIDFYIGCESRFPLLFDENQGCFVFEGLKNLARPVQYETMSLVETRNNREELLLREYRSLLLN